MNYRKSLFFGIIMTFSFSIFVNAQQKDPILFTVDGNPVHVSEFNYIYKKTNRDSADFSKSSIDQYLDLYIKFKLKVAKAKDMKLDTIPDLNKELAGYRRQLADSYLINKEVTERLVREAYDRSLQDVNFSHILILVDPNAAPEDTLVAYNKIMEAREKILSGTPFSEVALAYSQDNSVKRNNGNIGYLNVLFPNGFYPLESAVYNLPIGELSMPVRTRLGYHIAKVENRRPARAEIEAAHILVRTDDKSPEAAKAKIDSIYQLIEQDGNFFELAKQYSEDQKTAEFGGRLGFFGINRYSKEFENAAFGIMADNGYSKPVQTTIGWHIIQRLSRRPIQPYEIEKRRLENEIKRDQRFQKAKLAILVDIKEDGNFKEFPEVLNSFKESLDETFITAQWNPDPAFEEQVVFSLEPEFDITLGDFQRFLRNATGKRITYGRAKNNNIVVNRLYEEFVTAKCFEYEEANLERKYPDFKSLMREYEEGILLFEATKMLVWDKAAQDTTGLEAFFETIEGKYTWGPRAEITTYQIPNELQRKLASILSYIEKHSSDEVLEKFNTDETEITAASRVVEREQNMDLKEMEWRVGALSTLMNNPATNSKSVIKIERIIPATNKTLDEARGYVIADYQQYLEQEWISSLQDEYQVKINEDVLKNLIKE